LSVGDAIVAVDGELVSGKSLSQLAEKVRLRESESARERARARAGARARKRVGKGERSRERVWSDVAIFGVNVAGAGYD
jgi:C-terminal processing protease CtpA/Prc